MCTWVASQGPSTRGSSLPSVGSCLRAGAQMKDFPWWWLTSAVCSWVTDFFVSCETHQAGAPLAAQLSHPLGTLWFLSPCLRSSLSTRPGCHHGHSAGDHVHWPLAVRWPLFGYVSTSSPSETRRSVFCPCLHTEHSPQGTWGLQGLLPADFLTEGRVIWPGVGSVGRWWGVWSPALPSHLLELSHTFLRIATRSWHLTSFPIGQHQVLVTRHPVPTARDWIECLYQDESSRILGEWAMSIHSPLSSLCSVPSRSAHHVPLHPIKSWPYLSGRRCRSLSALPRKPLAFTERPPCMHDLSLSASLSSKLPIG